MIYNYLVAFARGLSRDRVFFFINILGLSLSLAIGMLSISFISDLTSYDHFQENKDRLFRIISTYQFKKDYTREIATTSNVVANSIQEDIPGIGVKTILRSNFTGEYIANGEAVPIDGIWADENFFEVFTYPLIAGDPENALKEPNSIVLTRKLALKLFNSTKVIGQTIKVDSILYVVKGITQDVPKLSHIQFDAIAAYSGIDLKLKQNDPDYYSWYNVWFTYVYVLSEKSANPETLNQALRSYCIKNNVDPYRNVSLALQPLNEIALGKDLGNPIGPTIPPVAPQFLAILSLLIILSACFNYTNLTIGRSLKRSKQVMIRKIHGASRLQVMAQFISESILVSLLAAIFSMPLYMILKSWFFNVHPYISELVSLDLSSKILVQFLLLAVATGAVAGLLPSIHFSKLEALKTLRNAPAKSTFRGIGSFRLLIFCQFIFSLALVTATTIGYSQYKAIINFNLGFATQNIVNLQLHGHDRALLASEIRQIRDVKEVSSSMLIPSIGYLYNMHVKFKSSNDSIKVYINRIDDHYIGLHQHELIAGRNFSQDPFAAKHQVIINEKLLRRLGIPASGEASQIIGEHLDVHGDKLMIIGVVKDFHYATIDRTIQPFMFLYSDNPKEGYLNILINPVNTQETLMAIADKWTLVDNEHPVEVSFFEDQIVQAYRAYLAIIKVTGFVATLAIVISALGILGIVVFSIQTKLREISIRKILGAGQIEIFFHFCKGLLLTLAIATIVVLPSVYLLLDQLVLITFAFHKPISLFDVLFGGTILWVLTLLIVLTQTIQAGAINPTQVLRTN